MTFVKFEPFRELENFGRRMNEMMKNFDDGLPFDKRGFTPCVDVSEDEKNVYIHVELPGMSKEDVQVTVNEDHILTIKGEKKMEHRQQDEAKNFVRIERNYGSFTRSFSLPDNVQVDGVSGIFENGVLNLTLPKAAVTQPREMSVEIADSRAGVALKDQNQNPDEGNISQ